MPKSEQSRLATDPAYDAFTIQPSDIDCLSRETRALYIGTGGNLTVVMSGPSQAMVTFVNVQGGTLLPLAVVQVRSSGTTASDIVALY